MIFAAGFSLIVLAFGVPFWFGLFKVKIGPPFSHVFTWMVIAGLLLIGYSIGTAILVWAMKSMP